MFDPDAARRNQSLKTIKKNASKMVKEWILQMLPIDCQPGLNVNVKEVACGDPNCAPIDTIISLIWQSGGKGMFGIPLEVQDIQQDDLNEMFPDEETLQAWKRGEDAPWPKRPSVRFSLDDVVECRVGADPIRGWAPGRIVALYYSEPGWPPYAVAPYQIQLDDGRLIYAPRDDDQVIRLKQT